MINNLLSMTKHYIGLGYSRQNANARVCQDIILKAISQSSLSGNITIKGGVVMRGITGNIRRATQDLDLDFIRYPLTDEAIRSFVKEINCLEGIKIEINSGIEELSQQEYNGKRVYIKISDDTGYHFSSKIDLGVHKNIKIEQEEFCFDICMDEEGACLLMNTCEQIFAEKLRSLLKFGPFSTRYKDIFDLAYLSENTDKEKLLMCIRTYIYEDEDMKENSIDDIIIRINRTFIDRRYLSSLNSSQNKSDWLGIGTDAALEKITDFLHTLI
ncbi:MAG: nucleotidyl transferase AbiEii/AbiGii toxin family protein [Erysipelotrichaceae bacterium]|nr:nucleotidyl transferase AbiEii/AbiGii toxin family protein [Erysipelotrichaceae bacterium]